MTINLSVLLLSATVLVIQGGCMAWWSSQTNRGEKTTAPQSISLALIVVQLLLFGVNAVMIGQLLVAPSGLDLSYTQVCWLSTLLITATGWMFFAHHAQKMIHRQILASKTG